MAVSTRAQMTRRALIELGDNPESPKSFTFEQIYNWINWAIHEISRVVPAAKTDSFTVLDNTKRYTAPSDIVYIARAYVKETALVDEYDVELVYEEHTGQYVLLEDVRSGLVVNIEYWANHLTLADDNDTTTIREEHESAIYALIQMQSIRQGVAAKARNPMDFRVGEYEEKGGASAKARKAILEDLQKQVDDILGTGDPVVMQTMGGGVDAGSQSYDRYGFTGYPPPLKIHGAPGSGR